MNEGITANGIHTFRDLGMCIAERKIISPKIRTIRKKVPFMHGSYDFTRIGGEPIYEDTTAEYTFSIAEFETADMEVEKSKIQSFFAKLQDIDFTDDFSPGYTYHGSYIYPDWEENFGEGEFKAVVAIHPFKRGGKETIIVRGENYELYNPSDCMILPSSVIASDDTTIMINGASYAAKKGEISPSRFVLKQGANAITVGTGTVDFVIEPRRLV